MKVDEILKTNEAKIDFLRGLIRVAKCDEKLDHSEIQFYMNAAQSLGLCEEEQEKINEAWNSNSEINISFANNEEKMFFFIQAVQLCWIDDLYHDREQAEIRKIALELGISENAITEVEKWVEEGINWNKKSYDLLQLK